MKKNDPRKDRFGPLIAGIKKGEVAAANELFELVEMDLFKFSFYLCSDRHEAEDLTQEVFLKILKSLDRLENPEVFLPWAITLVRNQYIDRIRHVRSRREDLSADPEDLEAASVDPLEEGTRLDILNLQAGLLRLDPDSRTLLIQVYLLEHTFEEVAEVWKTSIFAVKSRACRARKKLRSILEKNATFKRTQTSDQEGRHRVSDRIRRK